jgi:hypothetical protein
MQDIGVLVLISLTLHDAHSIILVNGEAEEMI